MTKSRMPWASFLMMTAAAPARNPVGMLSKIMKRRSDMWVTRHVLNWSIFPLILSLKVIFAILRPLK